VNKKFGLALAALGVAWTSEAHAQSAVTLYGLIDAGIMYSNNVASGSSHGPLWQETSGAINGSRFGLRGTEALGNGLNSFFVLENGFNLNSGKLGQDNRLFGRSAYVGLGGDATGSLSVGLQYDSLVDFLRPLSAEAEDFGNTGFAHPFDNDNLVHSFALNNAIKYTSPNYSGLSFGGAYAFSNTTEFAADRAYSLGARYDDGPLTAAAAYMQLDGTSGAAADGALDPDEASANGKGGFVLGAGVQRTLGAGVNYAFGAARLGLVYTQSTFDDSTSFGAADGTVRFDNYEANARYAATPSLSFGVAYTFTDGSVDHTQTYGHHPHWHSVDFQTVYRLSKRTDVYFEALYQQVSGRNYVAFIDGAGGASSTDAQIAATVGVRTRF
jgi:GBP family porin